MLHRKRVGESRTNGTNLTRRIYSRFTIATRERLLRALLERPKSSIGEGTACPGRPRRRRAGSGRALGELGRKVDAGHVENPNVGTDPGGQRLPPAPALLRVAGEKHRSRRARTSASAASIVENPAGERSMAGA
jgi:hypothetical protein